MSVVWRQVSDWAKKSPMTLRLADRLGRGRGRLRFIDHLNPPVKPNHKPDLSNWENQDLAALWIGHATVLLRIGDMTILTDPVFAHRVGVGLGVVTCGPRRHVRAALPLRQLPHLDLIIVSHAHFDHLDRPTLSRLPKNVPIITSHRNTDLIQDLGFSSITEMRWGESQQINGLKITAQKVRHWGARTFYDLDRGFAAFVLEAGKRRILFGADTAYQDDFKEIGKVDLAILGIGAYNPYVQAHATPEQAMQMADHVRADHILPMHHSTFRLSHEPMHEPLERMLDAAGKDADRLVVRQVGGQWTME